MANGVSELVDPAAPGAVPLELADAARESQALPTDTQAPDRGHRNPRTPDRLFAGALCLVVLLTWLPRLSGPIDLRWDGGVYYVLGTSLAEGAGYRLLNEPGAIEATQYPPLLPALFALHQIAAGTSDPTRVGRHLRLTYLLLSVLLALSSYALLKGYARPIWAFMGASVVALHPTTVFQSDLAFAEVPFTLAVVLFFAVVAGRPSRFADVTAGLLAIAAFLLRTTGLALLVAWIADAFVARGVSAGLKRLLVAAVVVFGWQSYIWSVERSPAYASPNYAYQRADYLFYNVSYLRNFWYVDAKRPDAGKVTVQGLLRRTARNLSKAPLRAGESLSVARSEWRRHLARASRIPLVGSGLRAGIVDPALFLLGSIAMFGLVLQFARRELTIPIFAALYVAGISLTPWTYSDRYWVPLAPVLIVGLVHSIGFVGRRLEIHESRTLLRWGRRALLISVVLVVSAQSVSVIQLFRTRHQPVTYLDREGRMVVYRLFNYRDTYQALDRGLDQLRAEAEPGSIVAASMPHWVYLRTGLESVMIPFEPDPAHALQLLESVPVDYLVIDGRSRGYTHEYGLPAVRHAPDRWRRLFIGPDGDVQIFRRIPLE